MFKSDILNRIKTSGHNQVKVAIVDIDGILRGKYIHIDKFHSVVEDGFGFCNVVFGWDCADVCYDNSNYTGWHSGYPDALVKLDLDSYRTIPWENDVPFFLGQLVDANNKPASICPKSLLAKVIRDLAGLGYQATAGCEFEWFNFKETPDSLQDKNFANLKPITPGMFGYSLLRAGAYQDYCHDLLENLRLYDTPLEGLHTETGPGVYEAALGKAPAMMAADRAVLAKSAIKQIAASHGIIASFMARWHQSLPGCSGHIHVSLQNEQSGEPAFFAQEDPNKMSPVFKHFLAGLIYGLPQILPMLAPNVNSYKRLVEGFWAPTRATWGVDNRTVAMRVIPGSSRATRLELRVGGADINPYLALAACLGCGAYGIRHKLPLEQKPITGNGYEDRTAAPLGRNLAEATASMAASETAREIFGHGFVNHFVKSREWEWRQSQQAVTNWELQRYFEII